MEIVSKVEPKTITVIDLDVRYPGETAQATIRPEDTMTVSVDGWFITHANGEQLNLLAKHALWSSQRTHTITLPPDESDGPAHRTT